MMAISFDYSRAGRPVSPRAAGFPPFWSALIAGALLAAALPAAAQYQGQVNAPKRKAHELRAVGVLEWIGKPGHPKASRLVPITIWDGQQLQDASIYLARPAPLALYTDTEYKLKRNGKTIGLYDINTAGQVQGTWVGHGNWKPLPVAKPASKPKQLAINDFDDDESGPPILHRKQQPGDTSAKSGPPAPPPDPNRPIMKEPPKETVPASAAPQNQVAYSQALTTISDPDRPRLFRGKPRDSGPSVLPTLVGLPQDMHQTIAVSDATNHPDHVWTYSWTSPDEEAEMKTDLEQIARKELGLIPPPAPAKPASKRTASRKKARPAPVPPPPVPATLEDEKFRTFSLTYGSGPTIVFSAHTKGAGAQEKFITLIAQPGLYGNVAVLLKNVTDAAHLDDTPALHLIDAVDAMDDNRGELLFEQRGATQREFVLYRVLRGRVQKLFTSAPEAIVVAPEGTVPG